MVENFQPVRGRGTVHPLSALNCAVFRFVRLCLFGPDRRTGCELARGIKSSPSLCVWCATRLSHFTKICPRHSTTTKSFSSKETAKAAASEAAACRTREGEKTRATGVRSKSPKGQEIFHNTLALCFTHLSSITSDCMYTESTGVAAAVELLV